MCVEIIITLSKEDSVSKTDLKDWVQPDSKVELHLSKPFFSKTGSDLYISEIHQGCACSLLTDNADSNSLYWDLIPAFLPGIARLVESIRQHTKTGFSFQVHWVNEMPAEQINISIGELARIIENGKIGTKTKYNIA